MIILDTSPQTIIVIGRSGENIVTTVEFDITEYVNAFGNGYAYLWFVRPSDKYEYPIQLTATENNIVQWSVSSADTLYKGTGKVQLMYTVNNEIKKKSKIFTVKVGESLTPTDAEPPEPYQTWLDQVVQASAEATAGAETASAKADEASASATSASESALSASQNAEQTQAHVVITETNAQASAENAQNAYEYADDASRSASSAHESETNAEQARLEAVSARDRAIEAKDDAVQAKNDAIGAKNLAQAHALDAQGSATLAGQKATEADNSADLAQQYMTVATTKASQASQSEQIATQKATESAQSAQNAENDRILAVQAKNDALTAKTGAEAAQGKAEEAQGKAETAQDNAEDSADDAQHYADLSQQSAEAWLNTLNSKALSGSLVTFDDGMDGTPLKSLSVAIEPIQSGTGDPSPDNVRPITGHTQVVVNRTGKNLLNPSLYGWQTKTFNGIQLDVQEDGTIHAYGTATASGSTGFTGRFEIPNGTYSYLTEADSPVRCSYRKHDKESDSVGTLPNPFTADGSFEIYINLYFGTTGTVDCYIHPQIEASSTASSYEPYNAQSITIPLGDTVYGGTLDVTNGVLTVDRAKITVTDAVNVSRNNGTSYFVRGGSVPGVLKEPLDRWCIDSNKFLKDSSKSPNAAGVCFLNQGGNIRFNTSKTFETASDMMNAIGDIEFVYPLATPIEVPLTANQMTTLLGINNVWSDASELALEYYTNTTPQRIDDLEEEVHDIRVDADGHTYDSAGDAVRAIQQKLYDALPIDSATGSIAHITDGANSVPVKALSVDLEPIQDLNGQDSPYPAGGGGNLVDFDEVVTAVVDAPLVQLTAGTYYLYVANEKTVSFNSYAQYSTDGTTFANIPTSSEGADVYTNQVMNYNTKKCILTVVNPVYVRVRIQTNGNLSGATVKVLLTKDSTNYSVIPNAVYSTNADFQAIYKPYSNICPITGHTQVAVTRTGKNLSPQSAVRTTASGAINLGTSGTFGHVKANQQYTISVYSNASTTPATQIRVFDGANQIRVGTKNFIANARSSFTFTPTVDGEVCLNANYGSSYVSVDVFTDVQLEIGSSATAYEPYQPIASITIPLGDTVYGGTLDVVNGVLTVDRKYALCTNFRAESQYDVGNSKLFSHADFADAVSTSSFAGNESSLSDKLPWATYILNFEELGFYVAYGRLWARIPGITTLADFNTAIGGELTCVYPIATPVTINLTPQQMTTLLGINNVWSDSGDVSVDYRADVQLYIQKMIAQALNA